MIPPRPAFPFRLWLFGTVVWGCAMALSALSGLYLRFRLETGHLPALTLLYFAGGALGWFTALPLLCPFLRRWGTERRFAAVLLVLTCATVIATAGLFALDYRSFYSQWHSAFGTRIWVYQFVFTTAGAVYQFLVLGLRLYLPAAFAPLLVASLFLARSMR